MNNNDNNHVLLILDACRYDTFTRTEFENFPDEDHTLKAGAPAVWTIPSFISYFLGYSPAGAEKWSFDAGPQCRWLPSQLRSMGYNVEFHSGSAWMALHEDMFNRGWTNYDVELEKDRMDEYSSLTDYESPFVHVFHVLEPHHPSFDGEEKTDFKKDLFHNFRAQQDALEYVDEKFGEMVANLPEDTIVTVTADHGDSFGEDESWGHNPNSASVAEGYMLKNVPNTVTEIPYARGDVRVDEETGEKFVKWRPVDDIRNKWRNPRDEYR